MTPALWSALILLAFPADAPVEADLLIRGITLHDGSGKPAEVGDLALRGDRIAAIGRFTVKGKPRVIDGKGLIAAPGFIDLHTHSDEALTLQATRGNVCYLLQGVTTVVTGNCGMGPTQVGTYFRTLERGGIGSNVIHQVPHNDVRRAVMKNANRAPTAEELERMGMLVEQGMKEGAWGLSTGLIYNPGTYAKTDELIALAKVAARHGGFYASHIRDEGVSVLEATEEAIQIGRQAGLPVHISHMKATGRSAWGKSADQIALIEKARAGGQVVTADQYPYIASSTSLAAIVVPSRFREGDANEFLARLDDPDQGPLLREAVQENLDRRTPGQSLRVAFYRRKPHYNGKNLEELAEQEKKTVLDIVLEIERGGGAQMVSFGMNEEDVKLIMKQPFVATASDGSSQVPGISMPHPRSYGCFPRKVGRYAIEESVISLEHALRSCSSLPADILKLPERGYLKAGFYADVVILDPKTFRDQATFDKPHQFARGVRYLFVNGKMAVADGKATGALAGKVLRHKSN
jgi:N-acyl-D-amino-acid deacylase